jgi:hypothetical protein
MCNQLSFPRMPASVDMGGFIANTHTGQQPAQLAAVPPRQQDNRAAAGHNLLHQPRAAQHPGHQEQSSGVLLAAPLA